MKILLFGMPLVSLGSQSATKCPLLSFFADRIQHLLHLPVFCMSMPRLLRLIRGFLLSMLLYFYIHRPTSALVKTMAVCFDA